MSDREFAGYSRRHPRHLDKLDRGECPAHAARGPAQLPAAREVGLPRRVRREGTSAQGDARVHADPDHLLQLRVGVRPARARGQGRPDDHEARGQPGAPGLARAQLRQGPGHHQPDQRPRADPAPAAAGRRARRRAVGAVHLGRRPRRHRRPDPRGDRRGPSRRGDVPRRPARRGRLRGALPARLGRRRPQLPHQHLLVRRTARLHPLGRLRPARRPTTRTPRSILLLSSHLETGHYFNPHAQRIMEAKAAGTKLVVRRPADVQHRRARRPLARPVAGERGRDPARSGVLPAADPADRPRLPAALGQLGDLPRARAPRGRRRRSRRSSRR